MKPSNRMTIECEAIAAVNQKLPHSAHKNPPRGFGKARLLASINKMSIELQLQRMCFYSIRLHDKLLPGIVNSGRQCERRGEFIFIHLAHLTMAATCVGGLEGWKHPASTSVQLSDGIIIVNNKINRGRLM